MRYAGASAEETGATEVYLVDVPALQARPGGPAGGEAGGEAGARVTAFLRERVFENACNSIPVLAMQARNTAFCPSPEKFHTVVLRGVRNISEAP